MTVTVDGTQETSAGNTLVPNRINVRAIITSAYLSYSSTTSIDSYRILRVTYSFERQVDGEWDKYPTSITTPVSYTHLTGGRWGRLFSLVQRKNPICHA